jgi:anti-sigma-K factor RskA
MELTQHPSPEDLSGYALGALDTDEAREISAHLASCAECREIVASYARVADGLLFAVPPNLPPPQLRARLAESIASGSAVSPATPQTRAVRPRFSAWQVGLALTTAALFVAVLLLVRQVRVLQVQETLLIQLLQRDREVLAVLVQPDVTVVPLKTGAISGNLAIAANGTQAAMVLEGLPNLDLEHAFQVWLIPSSGDPQSAGLFLGEANQLVTTVLLNSPKPWKDFSAVGVSIEPRSGSLLPTTQPILVAKY